MFGADRAEVGAPSKDACWSVARSRFQPTDDGVILPIFGFSVSRGTSVLDFACRTGHSEGRRLEASP